MDTIHLIFIVTLCLQEATCLTCDQQCPSDKPYCSDVGCIFECPEPFYINGSNCVSDCGDLFVDENRNCVLSCPENTFSEEKLIQSPSGPYLERTCVKCNYNRYIYLETCVKACPVDARFIDSKSCVNECPPEKQFNINITLFGVPHFHCVAKCPSLHDGQFCTDKCPTEKVVLNSSCVSECPSTSPFLLSQSCLNECPELSPSASYESRTCLVTGCPPERMYVFNNTCVDECPETHPLIYYDEVYNYNTKTHVGLHTCLEKCKEGQLQVNSSCFYECPLMTVAVNGNCFEECPTDAPLYCKDSKCNSFYYKIFIEKRHEINNAYISASCVADCPHDMYIWNSSCVHNCPRDIPLFENECTDECPIDYPVRFNQTTSVNCNWYGYCDDIVITLKCVRECPANMYIYNNVCHTYCPSPLYSDDNTCVQQCPEKKPFIQNKKLSFTIWSEIKYSRDRYRKTKQNADISVCSSSCNRGQVRLNSTCLDSCPENYNFLRNETCSSWNCSDLYFQKTNSGTRCLSTCNDNGFSLNNTCVKTCPENYKQFNGSCVAECPESNKYISIIEQNKITREICVDKCAADMFVDKIKCVKFCKKPMLTLDKTCVQSCPISSPYIDTLNVPGKPDEVIGKCVSVCPNDKVISNSRCVYQCPVHSRYIRNETCGNEPCNGEYMYFVKPGVKCFEKCPDDLSVLGRKCLEQCPDNVSYALGQNCVSECPPDQNIVFDTVIARHTMKCSEYYHSWHWDDALCSQNVSQVKMCLGTCPEHTLYNNRSNTCQNFCSEDAFVFRNNCMETCPESHPIVQPWSISKSIWKLYSSSPLWYKSSTERNTNLCVMKCLDQTPLQFETSCLKQCPSSAPYVYNNKCVSICPEDMFVDVTSKSCVAQCARDKGLFNRTCYSHCPISRKYIHQSQCVSECPSAVPVAVEENRYTCQKTCPDKDKLFRDGKCVYSFECQDPMIEFEGLCISSCLKGYVWFFLCHYKLWIISALSGLIVLYFGLCLCSFNGLVEFYHVLKLTLKSESEITETDEEIRREYIEPRRKTKKEDGEILIPHCENDETETESNDHTDIVFSSITDSAL